MLGQSGVYFLVLDDGNSDNDNPKLDKIRIAPNEAKTKVFIFQQKIVQAAIRTSTAVVVVASGTNFR